MQCYRTHDIITILVLSVGFMAKSNERNKAIALRQKGKSIKQIAQKLKVSKSSVSLWCRDVTLSPKQIQSLHEKMVRGSYLGRMVGSKMQHEKRMQRVSESEKRGLEEIGKLSKRDLLISLIALYWGEGSKKKRELFINNSDPEMVQFLMKAFEELFDVKKDRFILAVGINIIHKHRDKEIREYWSDITNIPLEQFRKTIFIKAKNKKNYSNFATHYGTLRINISRSIDIYYRIMGLIKGLKNNI